MRYVIIGNSAAGTAAAEGIRRWDRTGQIVVISDEPHPAYHRPLIPYLIEGTKPPEQIRRDPAHLPANLDVRLGRRVTRIDPAAHTVALDDGAELSYDRLLLATGSSPIRPPIPGLDGPGVYTLRRWDDALAIAQAVRGASRAVILGAGRIGMKCAFALRHLGLAVTVVELMDRIVPQQLDAASAAIFTTVVRAAGIEVILDNTFTQIEHRADQPKRIALRDGRELAADLVIVATGVRANVELAQAAGLRVDRGVLVDEGMRTSAPGVYAAGDVVQTTDVVTGEAVVSGIWTNAVAMGHVAGENMAGGDRRFVGAFSLLNAMDLGGLPVISVGEINPVEGNGYQVFAWRRDQVYRKLVFRDDVLVGLIFIGQVERAGVYQTLVREKAHLGALKARLVEPNFNYGHFVTSQPVHVDRYLAA